MIEAPDLNCDNCQRLRSDALPACETPEGCPIYDDASDPLVEECCRDFLAAKALQATTGEWIAGHPLLDKWELRESPYTLLDLEGVYTKWTNGRRQKQ